MNPALVQHMGPVDAELRTRADARALEVIAQRDAKIQEQAALLREAAVIVSALGNGHDSLYARIHRSLPPAPVCNHDLQSEYHTLVVMREARDGCEFVSGARCHVCHRFWSHLPNQPLHGLLR
jgi:hypothetical protein